MGFSYHVDGMEEDMPAGGEVSVIAFPDLIMHASVYATETVRIGEENGAFYIEVSTGEDWHRINRPYDSLEAVEADARTLFRWCCLVLTLAASPG